VNRIEQSVGWRRLRQGLTKLRRGQGFPFNGQPEQEIALQGREASKVLGQDGANVVKDGQIGLQKRRHITAKEFLNGFADKQQRQRVP
jgi:hypothetical protein